MMRAAAPTSGWPTPGIAFGRDYNPEQWPEEIWQQDVVLMREAGVSVVTVAVFAWARLQPRPGAWDDGWLRRVLDLLHQNGIAVDLATASASPPPWLVRAHPEIRPVDAHGTRLEIGSRQTWCPSSPVFREHSLALVRELATRFGDLPAVVMWHVSNELGNHNGSCFCEVSQRHFRAWLRARYGDVETLNDQWGTAFRSQHYTSFDEIAAPSATTNFLVGTGPGEIGPCECDDAACAPHQDIVSNDYYPIGLGVGEQAPRLHLEFSAHLTCGLAGGRPG
jgi:beta-galactosidase